MVKSATAASGTAVTVIAIVFVIIIIILAVYLIYRINSVENNSVSQNNFEQALSNLPTQEYVNSHLATLPISFANANPFDILIKNPTETGWMNTFGNVASAGSMLALAPYTIPITIFGTAEPNATPAGSDLNAFSSTVGQTGIGEVPIFPKLWASTSTGDPPNSTEPGILVYLPEDRISGLLVLANVRIATTHSTPQQVRATLYISQSEGPFQVANGGTCTIIGEVPTVASNSFATLSLPLTFIPLMPGDKLSIRVANLDQTNPEPLVSYPLSLIGGLRVVTTGLNVELNGSMISLATDRKMWSMMAPWE